MCEMCWGAAIRQPNLTILNTMDDREMLLEWPERDSTSQMTIERHAGYALYHEIPHGKQSVNR